jgi:hypothetical protein
VGVGVFSTGPGGSCGLGTAVVRFDGEVVVGGSVFGGCGNFRRRSGGLCGLGTTVVGFDGDVVVAGGADVVVAVVGGVDE